MQVHPKLIKKYPAIDEIQFRYTRLRSLGHSREESLKKLFKWDQQYATSYEELILHRIGLGDILAERGELYEDMAILTGEAVDELICLHPRRRNELLAERERILRADGFGAPAVYPRWEEFRPGWQNGELFALRLKGEIPELFQLEDKYLLLLVQGERRGEEGYWEQLVYLSICEASELPRSREDFLTLGFLAGFTLFREYQYLFALRFRREEELRALNLIKLGDIPGEYIPLRERDPKDRNAVVLVPGRGARDEVPLVRGACCAYLHFGNIATPEQAQNAKKDWNYGAKSRAAAGIPRSGITIESIPIGQLGSRTYFTHHSTLADRIPHKSFRAGED